MIVCTEHQRHYTLYPLGFVPYGRNRIAPVGEDGQVLSRSVPDLSAWEGTVFEAVSGETAPTSGSMGLEPGTRQRRRALEFAARLLGVIGNPRDVERSAVLLDVDLVVLTTARAAYAQARGILLRARALAPVLLALPLSGPLLLRVLCAGTFNGAWGGAWWWTPGSGYVRSFQSWERE